MACLTYFLIAVTVGLLVSALLAIAIGRPKLKHHLDEQTRKAGGGEGE